MRQRKTKGDKREVREEMHLTRPPRLEGVVKNAKSKPKKKPKKVKVVRARAKKEQGLSEHERKQYHLKSKHH